MRWVDSERRSQTGRGKIRDLLRLGGRAGVGFACDSGGELELRERGSDPSDHDANLGDRREREGEPQPTHVRA